MPQGFLDNLVPWTKLRRREKAAPGPCRAPGMTGRCSPFPTPTPRSDAAERGSPGPGPPAGPAAQRHGGRHPHGSHLNPQHPIKFLLTHAPAPVTVVPPDWAGGDPGETSLSCSCFSRHPEAQAGDAWPRSEPGGLVQPGSGRHAGRQAGRHRVERGAQAPSEQLEVCPGDTGTTEGC